MNDPLTLLVIVALFVLVAAAALSVTRAGAQPSLATGAEVERFLQSFAVTG